MIYSVECGDLYCWHLIKEECVLEGMFSSSFVTLFTYLVIFIENTTVKPQMPKSIKKKLSSNERIERKATSKRPDQLIKLGNYELETVEGSKIDDEYSSKFFLDSMKKNT